MNDIRAFKPDQSSNMPLVLAYYIADADRPLQLTLTLGYYCKQTDGFVCLRTKAKILPFAYWTVPEISRELRERGRRAYKTVD